MIVEYRCPRCKGSLEELAAAYRCGTCERSFPVVLGIPDFRLRPDPYLSIAEDHAKARLLAARAAELDLRGLVEYYWQLTPDTPPELASRFVEHALQGRDRGRHWLGANALGWVPAREGRGGLLRAVLRTRGNPSPALPTLPSPAQTACAPSSEAPAALSGRNPPASFGTMKKRKVSGGKVLELGCRSGGVLAAAAELGAAVVGIDIAFRWLVVARKCMEEAGLTAQLCCCDAEHLPFADGSFDLVLAENVLEHTARQGPLLAEAHRALRGRGVAFGTTWNRLAPAPEPHVRLWGVGLLPRGMARRYVRWRGRGDYEHVHLLSAFALRRLLLRSPFGGGAVRAADLAPGMVEGLPAPGRSLARLYRAARGLPLAGEALAWVGPVLEWECVRPG